MMSIRNMQETMLRIMMMQPKDRESREKIASERWGDSQQNAAAKCSSKMQACRRVPGWPLAPGMLPIKMLQLVMMQA